MLTTYRTKGLYQSLDTSPEFKSWTYRSPLLQYIRFINLSQPFFYFPSKFIYKCFSSVNFKAIFILQSAFTFRLWLWCVLICFYIAKGLPARRRAVLSLKARQRADSPESGRLLAIVWLCTIKSAVLIVGGSTSKRFAIFFFHSFFEWLQVLIYGRAMKLEKGLQARADWRNAPTARKRTARQAAPCGRREARLSKFSKLLFFVLGALFPYLIYRTLFRHLWKK